MGEPVKVVVVDDSALIRRLLTELLNQDADIHVVASAVDAYDARDKIKATNPDVVTLDIEMPHMDGLSFLAKIMALRPMPVVMISTLTENGAAATLEALELGAVDYIPKPKMGQAELLSANSDHLCRVVKNAARAKVRQPGTAPPAKRIKPVTHLSGNIDVIAIGASTGGVEALRKIISGLPTGLPPIVITQHMPAGFTGKFAERLNNISDLTVTEALDNVCLQPGCVYVAPGNKHLVLRGRRDALTALPEDSAPISGHKPSVDVMFRSVAETVGGSGLGIILTGMGRDGAQGLLRLSENGGVTIGQDEQSSVVYGMPKAALQVGAVQKQVSLSMLAAEIVSVCQSKRL